MGAAASVGVGKETYSAADAALTLGEAYDETAFAAAAGETGVVSREALAAMSRTVLDKTPVKIHWFPGSQPSRAVVLLLQMSGVPHELVFTNLMAGQKVPFGTGSVPYMEDDATGVSMGEGAAIMLHIADTRGLDAFYPRDPKSRAYVHYWTTWAQTGVRQGTHFLRSLYGSDDVDEQFAKLLKAIPQFKYMEERLVWQGTNFFANDSVTIADMFVLTEVDQFDILLDIIFRDGLFPKLEAWKAAMAEWGGDVYVANIAPMKSFVPMLEPKALKLREHCEANGFAEKLQGLCAAAEEGAPPAADADGDGTIDFQEFKNYLMQEA